MGMQGIDSWLFVLMHTELNNLVNLFKKLIAKLASKVKDSVSPYFGMKDFAFAPAFA